MAKWDKSRPYPNDGKGTDDPKNKQRDTSLWRDHQTQLKEVTQNTVGKNKQPTSKYKKHLY